MDTETSMKKRFQITTISSMLIFVIAFFSAYYFKDKAFTFVSLLFLFSILIVFALTYLSSFKQLRQWHSPLLFSLILLLSFCVITMAMFPSFVDTFSEQIDVNVAAFGLTIFAFGITYISVIASPSFTPPNPTPHPTPPPIDEISALIIQIENLSNRLTSLKKATEKLNSTINDIPPDTTH
ncbi:MAG TPA: hypothetical protein VGA85_04135 [Dehalococcoidales bacterium]